MGIIPAGINTPQIIVDVAKLQQNIDRVAHRVASQGLKLRPHAKTHKMHEIAERQMNAGAAGLTVATVGEALAFALHGVAKIFIAYPLEGAGILQCDSVVLHLRDGVAAALHAVPAQCMLGLRGEPDVPDDGHTGKDHGANVLGVLRGAFHLDRVGMAFLHQAHRGGHGLCRRLLVAAKRQVGDDQRALGAIGNSFGEDDHFVEADRQRGLVAEDGIGG